MNNQLLPQAEKVERILPKGIPYQWQGIDFIDGHEVYSANEKLIWDFLHDVANDRMVSVFDLIKDGAGRQNPFSEKSMNFIILITAWNIACKIIMDAG